MTSFGMGVFAGCSAEVAEVVDSILRGIRKPARQRCMTKPPGNARDGRVTKIEGPAQVRASSGALAASAAILREERRALVSQSIENALDLMGRTGRDIFLEILDKKYGMTRDFMAETPHSLMITLKMIFDSSAAVIEKYALRGIKERTGIEASTLEEAVAVIKAQEWMALIEDVREKSGFQRRILETEAGAHSTKIGEIQ